MKNLFLLILIFCFSCKNEPHSKENGAKKEKDGQQLSYAQGFSIEHKEDYILLEIKNPWPDSNKTYRYALVSPPAAPEVNPAQFEAVITIPVQRIVVTSTTHLPALDLLESEERLVGFPGTDYISSEKIRARVDEGKIRSLGKNESINTEILLSVAPELVVAFGIDGNNKTFDNIKKAGIPVIYNADWLEKSPLAKAEWIKFFGVLLGKEKMADSIFSTIESDYLAAKAIAQESKKKPTALSGALYRDVWYLPGGASAEAILLKDAHALYLWEYTDERGSLSLNFENVLSKAQDADFWISPSSYGSLSAMSNANPHYSQFKAYKNGKVYSFVNTKGKTGGVTYFEQGMARPDLVLKDLIKIAHPELLPDYDFTFFQKLTE